MRVTIPGKRTSPKCKLSLTPNAPSTCNHKGYETNIL